MSFPIPFPATSTAHARGFVPSVCLAHVDRRLTPYSAVAYRMQNVEESANFVGKGGLLLDRASDYMCDLFTVLDPEEAGPLK